LNDNRNQELLNGIRTQERLFQEKLVAKDREICEVNEKLETLKSHHKECLQLVTLLLRCNQELMSSAHESLQQSDNEKVELIHKCSVTSREKDQAIEDVEGVENSFSELHRRYEKMKSALESCKHSEEQLRAELMDTDNALHERNAQFELMRAKAEEAVDNASLMIETSRKEKDREMASLRVQLKKAEMKANGLQAQLDQKTQENIELTQMVDEMTKHC
jgi:hypothetical protein